MTLGHRGIYIGTAISTSCAEVDSTFVHRYKICLYTNSTENGRPSSPATKFQNLIYIYQYTCDTFFKYFIVSLAYQNKRNTLKYNYFTRSSTLTQHTQQT